MISHIPANDPERLEVVRRYDVLDTPPDGAFDRITALASRIFDVPIALVTIVDEDRIWFKSRAGLEDVSEIPRDPGLCASAICGDVPYIVEAARSDPRTLANPLVAGAFGLQFYAAAPLRTHDGFNLGTLCLLDREPRKMSADETVMLETLAAVIMDELELRLHAMGTVASERTLKEKSFALARENERLYQREHRVARTLQRAMLPQVFPAIRNVHFDAVYVPASTESEVGGDWYDAFLVTPELLLLSIGDVAGHGLHAATLMGKLRQSLRAIALNESSPRELLRLLDEILRSEDEEGVVTAFVAIFDIKARVLHYANAGHPQPILRFANGAIEELGSTGAPIGLRSSDDPPDASVVIERDSILVLYTDGITESTRNVIEGERRLKEAVGAMEIASHAKPAVALREQLVPRGVPDDVAIMAVSFG